MKSQVQEGKLEKSRFSAKLNSRIARIFSESLFVIGKNYATQILA